MAQATTAATAGLAQDNVMRIAIGNFPVASDERLTFAKQMGLPGRNEQIENDQTIIRNMGAAGIPILGYHWMPNTVWRTSFSTPGRGGAECTASAWKPSRTRH